MNTFAKIFDNTKYGQVLVKLDTNDEHQPEIRFFFHPDQLDVCSMAILFKNEETCDENSERAFLELTEEKVEKAIGLSVEETEAATDLQLTFNG